MKHYQLVLIYLLVSSDICLGRMIKHRPQISSEAFFKAAETNDRLALQTLLKKDTEPDIKNKNGDTALHLTQDRDSMRSLRFSNASLNIKNNDGLTPLLKACKENNIPKIQFLLSVGANAKVGDIEKKTPLWYAIEYNHYDLVVEILRQRPIITQQLMLFAQKKNSAIAQLLKWYHFEKNSRNRENLAKSGLAPLHEAIQQNDVPHFDACMVLGVNINQRTSDGQTSLHLAIGNSSMLKKVIQYWPRVKIPDNTGQTALHLAIQKEDVESIMLLLDFHANMHLRNSQHISPKDLAARTNNPLITSLFR